MAALVQFPLLSPGALNLNGMDAPTRAAFQTLITSLTTGQASIAKAFDSLSQSGSANPVGAGAFVGQSFYNTTLGQPVWWNGQEWSGAAGGADVGQAAGAGGGGGSGNDAAAIADVASETSRAESAEGSLATGVQSADNLASAASTAASTAKTEADSDTVSLQKLITLLSPGGTMAQALDPLFFALSAGGTLTGTQPLLVPDGVTNTSVAGTDGFDTLTSNYLNPDGISLSAGPNGTEEVVTTSALSLTDRGAFLPTDTVVVVSNNGTTSATFKGTIAELQTFLLGSTNLDTLPDQAANSIFTVTGELYNKPGQPPLYYSDNGGQLQPFPTGSTIVGSTGPTSPGSFSFPHPAVAATSNFTLQVFDGLGNPSNKLTFNISGSIASGATMTGVPATATRGTAITGMVVNVTPTGDTVYCVLYNETTSSFEGTRVAVVGGNNYSPTPQADANYKVNIFTQASGGTKLYTSSTIVASG